MAIKIIAAVAANGVIGRKGQLPWRLRDDLQFFKRVTTNHPVVMGRTTLCEIISRLHKPLPDRKNIVLTRDPRNIRIDGVAVLDDFAKVVEMSRAVDLFVIGGESLYRLALPFAKEMYLTSILAEIEGDTYFPEWKAEDWWLAASSVVHPRDAENDHEFVWQNFRRVKPVSV